MTRGRHGDSVTVFADVSCPYAHVSLRRLHDLRVAAGRSEPRLWVRAWPLELVNGAPLTGAGLAPKIEALRARVAPDLFAGFDPTTFPATTMPALATEAAAYRVGVDVGERTSLALRDALFERGLDVADADVLAAIRDEHGVPEPTVEDDAAVCAAFADGRRLGVKGSPHFFTANGGFFCPSLVISHTDDAYDVRLDPRGFSRLVSSVFVPTERIAS